MKRRLIGGIDEAGRGPLAGPVSVAMIIAPSGFRFRHPELGRIKDCKQLTQIQRERWYLYLTTHPKLSFVHTYVSSRVIDRINILRAVHRGTFRLVERCAKTPSFIYLDGTLKCPATVPHKIIIGGDEKVPVIAAASIIAKVRRDRYMARMAKRFPLYNFEVHKGYGTRRHIEALKLQGPSPLHRKSFIRSFI